MAIHKPPFQVPRDELLFITPDIRKKLFINLLKNYEIYCPGMKLEYAYMNFNSKYPIDYVIVFSGVTSDGVQIILWKTTYLYANNSIPGYRYVIKNNLHELFFKEEAETFCKISLNRFKEFLTVMCRLSWNEGESCWKNAEFGESLMDNLSELSLRYTPKK